MSLAAQIELIPAQKVTQQALIEQSQNGICYALFGHNLVQHDEVERLVQAVPTVVAVGLVRRAYYFVPLTLAEGDETMVSPGYTIDLGDRASCHRNVKFDGAEATFISTRLVDDRFGLAFEFFINAAHEFVETAGVPASFGDLVCAQAKENVRGETSHDAWESRKRAWEHKQAEVGESAVPATPSVDERAKNAFIEATFSDALAVYMLSMAQDFDYYDLREREYPLLAAPALAERLRAIAVLFPPNAGYEFQILYRKRG
jgi:hypothetical protein